MKFAVAIIAIALIFVSVAVVGAQNGNGNSCVPQITKFCKRFNILDEQECCEELIKSDDSCCINNILNVASCFTNDELFDDIRLCMGN